MKKYLVIDFDSTFVKVEALDCLAEIALEGRGDKQEILSKVSDITNQGMEGKISFSESLSTRLKMFSASKEHIERLIGFLKDKVSGSAKDNRNFFVDNSENIYIISGGFEEYIVPVVSDFGIAADHVIANKFVFDEKGNVLGADQTRALSRDDGKVLAMEKLGLEGSVCVVGDGFTDYKIKQKGFAETFYVFCENVRRRSVVQKADKEVSNFSELKNFFYA